MDTNPYQSPAPGSYAAQAAAQPQVAVEGKSLVLPSGMILPPICIKTNQPVSDADMVRKDLYWCSPYWALLILISGCLVIIAYLLARKRFTITYGLAPEVRKKYRGRVLTRSLASIGFFVAMIVAGAMDAPAFLLVFLLLFLVALVSIFIGTSPISISNYRQGWFWVKGCCPEYLARIGAAPGTGQMG